MWDIVKNILTDNNFIGAIFMSLGFILLGYFLRRKNIITNEGKNAIIEIVLKIALPAMAFNAFMTDFNVNSFKENIMILIFSLALYVVIIGMGHLIFCKEDKDSRSVMSIFIAVSQITFFSIPILKAVYNDSYEVLLPANMLTLAFRLVLYIYCYLVISKLNFSRENLKKSVKKIIVNPIMIAMFIGVFVWISQLFMPTTNINGIDYSFLRIDKTIPSIYKIISAADKLTTPLAMIIVGCILGESNFSEAFKDKKAWVCSILRTMITPLIVLALVILLQAIGVMNFTEFSTIVLVIGFGAPLSAVVNTYCSTYNNNQLLASRVCLLSTLLCIITFPILFIMVKLIITFPIF